MSGESAAVNRPLLFLIWSHRIDKHFEKDRFERFFFFLVFDERDSYKPIQVLTRCYGTYLLPIYIYRLVIGIYVNMCTFT